MEYQNVVNVQTNVLVVHLQIIVLFVCLKLDLLMGLALVNKDFIDKLVALNKKIVYLLAKLVMNFVKFVSDLLYQIVRNAMKIIQVWMVGKGSV